MSILRRPSRNISDSGSSPCKRIIPSNVIRVRFERSAGDTLTRVHWQPLGIGFAWTSWSKANDQCPQAHPDVGIPSSFQPLTSLSCLLGRRVLLPLLLLLPLFPLLPSSLDVKLARLQYRSLYDDDELLFVLWLNWWLLMSFMMGVCTDDRRCSDKSLTKPEFDIEFVSAFSAIVIISAGSIGVPGMFSQFTFVPKFSLGMGAKRNIEKHINRMRPRLRAFTTSLWLIGPIGHWRLGDKLNGSCSLPEVTWVMLKAFESSVDIRECHQPFYFPPQHHPSPP